MAQAIRGALRDATAEGPFAPLSLQSELTHSMARRHGVCLSEAMSEGILTRTDFAGMLSRCSGCTGGVQDCLDFLAGQDESDGTVAPDWCANSAILEGLRGLV